MNPFYLVGCTAVGKSAVAIELARKVGGEIISVDSMQVYRGLDIGTAKPSLADRAAVPHHLIDVVDLHESFNAGRFVEMARPILAAIQAHQRRAIFCGGTGLYFSAFLHGLGSSPAAEPKLREELERLSPGELIAELKMRDPVAAEQIDHRNKRRLIRAVEVSRLSGRPFSAQQATWQLARPGSNSPQTGSGAGAPLIFGLQREDEELRRRIDQRVERMFATGLIEETRGLFEKGLAENRTASQALGYRQVITYLKEGGSRNDLVQEVKQKTWRFAKRQKTWFRTQLRVKWIPMAGDEYGPFVERLLAESREYQA